MTYTMDGYNECVVNSDETFTQVAMDLYERGHVVTTWTDGEGSKFDLVWSWDATRIGRSSMVDPGPGKLFVGVVGTGCFGFTLSTGFLASDYVGEKLKVTGSTARQLALLIGKVREYLFVAVRSDVKAVVSGLGLDMPVARVTQLQVQRKSAEQQARDMLERMEVEGAQSYSAGELVELANLIADNSHLKKGQ